MITVFILLLLYTNNATKFYHSHYRKEHKDMLASFGLTDDSNFPTAAFLPAKRSNSNSLVINIIYFKIFTYWTAKKYLTFCLFRYGPHN